MIRKRNLSIGSRHPYHGLARGNYARNSISYYSMDPANTSRNRDYCQSNRNPERSSELISRLP